MNMEELLEQLDSLLDSGMKVPGRRVIVDAEHIRSIIDDLGMAIPNEVKQAKGIVSDRNNILESARREAEGIIHNAEERAKALVAEEEITKLAQAKAAEIISAAQNKSREMRRAAQDFVDDIVRRADESLTANLAEVRKTRASLKQQSPASEL